MEIYRLLKNKKLITAVICLLLFNCVAFFITQQKSIEDLGTTLQTYSVVFRENEKVFSSANAKAELLEKNQQYQILQSFADIERMKVENSDGYAFYAEEEALLIRENPALYKEYKASDYTYAQLSALSDFYAHFAYQAEYQDNYSSYINSIFENGKDLSSKKLFSNQNSFSYKSIQKSMKDYSKNKNIQPEIINDLPISAILNYQIGDFILILMCVFLAITLILDKNFTLLVNTGKNGRTRLKLKQLPILISFAFIASAAVHISELLISLKMFPAPINLSAPIQSVELFADCILPISVLQMLVLHIIFKSFVALAIALFIWLLIFISGNIIMVSGIAGVATAAELLLYKNISIQSQLSYLHVFNLFSLFDYSNIFNYNLIPLFSVPVNSAALIWWIVLILITIAVLLIVFSSKRNYPIKTPNRFFEKLSVLFRKVSIVYAKLQRFVYAGRFESFKIMHISKALLVMMAFFIIIGFNFNSNPIVFSSTESFLNNYYEEYSGILNSAVYDSFHKMKAETETIELEYQDKTEQFRQGIISLDEYQMAMAKYDAYDTQRNAIDKLENQIQRLEMLADKGIEPILINEAGYTNLFYPQNNQQEIVLLLCAVLLIFSGVFSIEKTSNMLTLNHCSKKGRKQVFFKKILAVVPKVFVLTLVSYLSLLLQTQYHYPLKNLQADIHNLQCLEHIGLNISIWQYILLNFVFEFAFVLLISMIITLLSVFAAQMVVIIISACLFILPSALYMINIDAAKSIAASHLFNLNALMSEESMHANSLIVHLGLFIFGIVLLWLSQRKWCLTKER